MSSEKFIQMKNALIAKNQTFTIGVEGNKTSCFVYKYGKCNLVYGFPISPH